VLLCMQEPTRPMRREAATAGFYESNLWGRHPRLQILTIAELLAGKTIHSPPIGQTSQTFKKAPRVRRPKPVSMELPFKKTDSTSE